MLYGYESLRENIPSTIVTAADEAVTVETWYTNISAKKKNYTKSRQTDFMDHLRNPEFVGLKHSVYIFNHKDEKQREKFIRENEIIILPEKQAKDRLEVMVLEVVEGIKGFDLSDNRPIGEIFGLNDGNDKWDLRTEDQKKAEAEGKTQLDQSKKRVGDHITGQSFDPNPRSQEDGVYVNRVSQNEDGSISAGAIKVGAGLSGLASSTSPQKMSRAELVKAESQVLKELENVGMDEETISEIMDSVDKTKFDNDHEYVFELQRVALEKINEHMKGVPEVVTDDLLNEKLDKIGKNDLEKQQIIDSYQDNYSGDDWKTELNTTLNKILKQKEIDNALQPIEGNFTKEEILDIVEEKLSKIDGLTEKEKNKLKRGVERKLNAPKPMPQDYLFAENPSHTANPSMGGKGNPVFVFDINKTGPNEGKFGLHELDIMLEIYGFEAISSAIYVYDLNKKPVINAKDFLKEKGFVEDISLLPQKIIDEYFGDKIESKLTIKRDVLDPEYIPSAADFAAALSGNLTSTVPGTRSYGLHKTGKKDEHPVPESITKMTREEIDEKYYVIEMDDSLKPLSHEVYKWGVETLDNWIYQLSNGVFVVSNKKTESKVRVRIKYIEKELREGRLQIV